MDPRQLRILNSFVVFFLAVYSCSLLIPILLNRFIIVVVNGHDDIEMWTTDCKLYDARDTVIGLEFEEAFVLNVVRKGRDVGFNSS